MGALVGYSLILLNWSIIKTEFHKALLNRDFVMLNKRCKIRYFHDLTKENSAIYKY